MADQDDTLTTPGIGDNISKFQLPTIDEVIAELESQNAPTLARVKELLEKGQKYFDIQDDAQDAKATEFLVAVRAAMKHGEAQRVAHKARYDDIAGAIHGFFKTRIWDLLGAAPSNAREEFDPTTATQFGVGTRIAMAQTRYKRAKAERERLAREEEARKRREEEAAAARARAEEERKRREEEDRQRREREAAEQARRDEEDRQRRERERVAAEQARQAEEAEAAARRKRSEGSRAQAEAEAQRRREEAAEAERVRLAEEERLRLEREERERQEAEQRRQEEEARQRREEEARAEENRLAEERAKAEEAAAASTADLSRARGSRGGVSSLRTFVDFRDLDRAKLGMILDGKGFPADLDELGIVPPGILKLLPYIKDAALESAVTAFEKANKATVADGIKNGRQPIHGVVFFQNSKSAGRA